MASSVRVRLSWNNEHIIVPVPEDLFSRGSVADLLQLATSRFRQFSSVTFDVDNSFVKILTADGFAFAPSDLLRSVLKDDDHLVVLDSASWIESQSKFLAGGLLSEASAVDFEENSRRWARVGWSQKLSKLYCSVGRKYNTTNKLVFFSLDDLKNFPKSQTVAEVTGAEWFVRIIFSVSGSRVNAVEFHVKNKSDQRAFIKQLVLQYTDDAVTAGAESVLQEPFVAPGKSYSVPQSVETGPKIAECLPYDADVPVPGLVENKSTGSCPVELKQHDAQAFVEQNWSSSEGFQNIYVEFMVKNNSNAQTTITEFKSEYLNGESWAPCHYTSWGYKDSRYYYSCQNRSDDMYQCEPGAVAKLALRAQIKLGTGPHLDHRARRLYSSLPRPLKLRFTWVDADKRSSSIEVVCTTSPPQLRDRAYFEKNRGLPALFISSCDDATAEERIHLVAYHNTEKQCVEVENKLKSSSLFLYNESIRKHAYLAAKEGKTEVELSDITYDQAPFSAKVFLLVDVAEKHGYAVKTFLKTSTSETTGYFLLPALSSA